MTLRALLNQTKVRQAIHTLTYWSPLWIGMTLFFGAASIIYAFVLKKDVWLASQSLIVRNEAIGTMMKLGRFESSTQMKAVQETIADMCKNPQVIKAAFLAAGPEKSFFGPSSDWPSASDVKNFANEQLSLHAPRGAEFGATEVVYLDVRHPSPERAVLLNQKICEALEEHLRNTRESRAESVWSELQQSREIARKELSKSTLRLQEIEKSVGADLPDLRSMVDAGGNSTSRTTLDQVRLEARQLKSRQEELINEFNMLEAAAANPDSFVNTPGSLLNSQPGLKKLREGLIDAQLNLSQLTGRFTEDHPAVLSTRSAIHEITNALNRELQAILSNSRHELKASQAKLDRTIAQEKDMENRLDRLAESRAIYANILAEVQTRANILENSERELAEVEASRLSSQKSSVLAYNGEPTVSDKPIGPGRTTLVGVCTMAGLVSGLGLTFLLSPIVNTMRYGRRWNDNAGQGNHPGRRTSDRNDAFLSVPTAKSHASNHSTNSSRPFGLGSKSNAAAPSNAQPSNAQPSIAQPSIAQPSIAQPSIAQPTTPPTPAAKAVEQTAPSQSPVESGSVQNPTPLPQSISESAKPSPQDRERIASREAALAELIGSSHHQALTPQPEKTIVLSCDPVSNSPRPLDFPNDRRQNPRKASPKTILPLNFALRDAADNTPSEA